SPPSSPADNGSALPSPAPSSIVLPSSWRTSPLEISIPKRASRSWHFLIRCTPRATPSSLSLTSTTSPSTRIALSISRTASSQETKSLPAEKLASASSSRFPGFAFRNLGTRQSLSEHPHFRNTHLYVSSASLVIR